MRLTSKIALLLFLSALVAAPLGAAVRDTFTGSYEMQPGAEVEVRGINGSVEIQSSTSLVAELRIERSADSRADMDLRPVLVDHDPGRLIIAVRSQEGRNVDVRDRLFLSLPDSTGFLKVSGVNGKVTAGYIEGNASVKGVNGKVQITQGGGEFTASGINGPIKVAMGVPEGEGIQLSGINGAINITLDGQPNADLDVSSHNGGVDIRFSDAEIERNRWGGVVRGRIGNGGVPISVKGVNGRLTIGR